MSSSISQEDLVDFHIKHIGPVPQTTENKVHDDNKIERYPDGEIRTLTDEQIAFFRASELRELEKKREAEKNINLGSFKNHHNEKRQTYPISSIEETKPYTPISNLQTDYEDYFGEFRDYIVQLETKNDEQFIGICRKNRVKDYYPILPINNS